MSSTTLLPGPRISVEDDRTGMDPIVLRRAFTDHVQYSRSRDLDGATAFDRYMALALAVRDRLVARWSWTQRSYYEEDVKRAYYLSAEFLLGRALTANLQALDIYDDYRQVLHEMGIDLDALVEREPDAGLGNGGLGRLAACFLESMATLGLPGSGYGIRYEFGIFEQAIRNGAQVERADEWLRFGNPWEIARPEYTVPVQFGGHTEHVTGADGGFRVAWRGGEKVLGVPYDTPIAGYGSSTVNTLRLWAARAGEEFDFCALQRRRLRPRRAEQERHRGHLQGPLPQRQLRGGARAAAAAGVLLRRLLHPRHRLPLPEDPRRLLPLRRQGGHPAQRHPPGHRHRRADARAGRRARRRLGRRLEGDGQAPSATPTTPCCRRRWSAGR